MDGRQIAIVNEQKEEWSLQEVAVEHDIREIARKNRNVYVIGLFACCREIFNSQKHRGYFGGT